MYKSAFNLTRANTSIDSKIVIALERISEAFRVLLWNESKEHSLSPIQVQLLIFIYFQDISRCKISVMAQEFNMTKATISDSVKALRQKGLVEKCAEEGDNRSFSICLTARGKILAERASQFSRTIEKPLYNLAVKDKETLLLSLLQLIYALNKNGVITVQRMCYSCYNYKKEKGKHYCDLLNMQLFDKDLRIDCPEHQPVL